MRRLILIPALLLFLVSCLDEHKVPNDILSPPKMQAVMWDMIRAGEYLNNYVFIKDSAVNKLNRSLALYDTVYRIHNITKADFEKSYDYYRNHSALMKELMDSLSKKDLQAERPSEAPALPAGASPPDTTAIKGKMMQRTTKAGLMVADSLKKVLLKEKK